MKKYEKNDANIHPLSRALLFQDDNIVLCKPRNDNWFFLPGGHIESGESAKTALLRELNEEIGSGSYEIKKLIGICENSFILKEDIWQQEINLIFEAKIPSNFEIKSQENHLEFMSLKIEDFKHCNFRPAQLKEGLINWLKDKKPFFIGLD